MSGIINQVGSRSGIVGAKVPNVIVYTSGATTWTKPSSLAYIRVRVVGGGGGGASSMSSRIDWMVLSWYPVSISGRIELFSA